MSARKSLQSQTKMSDKDGCIYKETEPISVFYE